MWKRERRWVAEEDLNKNKFHGFSKEGERKNSIAIERNHEKEDSLSLSGFEKEKE